MLQEDDKDQQTVTGVVQPLFIIKVIPVIEYKMVVRGGA